MTEENSEGGRSAQYRLGVVGVTGVGPIFGLHREPYKWLHADTPLDAPELIPLGHMMPNGHSWFHFRGEVF